MAWDGTAMSMSIMERQNGGSRLIPSQHHRQNFAYQDALILLLVTLGLHKSADPDQCRSKVDFQNPECAFMVRRNAKAA